MAADTVDTLCSKNFMSCFVVDLLLRDNDRRGSCVVCHPIPVFTSLSFCLQEAAHLAARRRFDSILTVKRADSKAHMDAIRPARCANHSGDQMQRSDCRRRRRLLKLDVQCDHAALLQRNQYRSGQFGHELRNGLDYRRRHQRERRQRHDLGAIACSIWRQTNPRR